MRSSSSVFRLMIRVTSICSVALALLGTGHALAPQPTPVPNVAPDFSSMNFLLGTWRCDDHQAGRPGKRIEVDKYSMVYDGWQMQEHAVSPPFDQYRTRDEVEDTFTTYDSTIRLWISVYVDNFGGYGLAKSPGWEGDTLVWTWTNPDGTIGREVFTKISDTKMSFTDWANDKKGQPMAVFLNGVCTKT